MFNPDCSSPGPGAFPAWPTDLRSGEGLLFLLAGTTHECPAWLPSCQMHSHMDIACSLVFWRLSARGLRDLDLLRNLMINLPSPWCPLSQPPPTAPFSGRKDKRKSHYSVHSIVIALSFELLGRTLLALELYLILDPLRAIIYLTGYL